VGAIGIRVSERSAASWRHLLWRILVVAALLVLGARVEAAFLAGGRPTVVDAGVDSQVVYAISRHGELYRKADHEWISHGSPPGTRVSDHSDASSVSYASPQRRAVYVVAEGGKVFELFEKSVVLPPCLGEPTCWSDLGTCGVGNPCTGPVTAILHKVGANRYVRVFLASANGQLYEKRRGGALRLARRV